MLTQLFDTLRPDKLQHDQKQAQAKAKVLHRCESLRLELMRHPERAEHLQAVIERAEAELRKYNN